MIATLQESNRVLIKQAGSIWSIWFHEHWAISSGNRINVRSFSLMEPTTEIKMPLVPVTSELLAPRKEAFLPSL